MRVGLVALACATLVAGCGGSGSQEDTDRYRARLTESQLRTDDLEFLTNAQGFTQPSQMPTGSARYEGDMGILLGPLDDPEAALIGDAVMDANFAQGTIDGHATNFIGTIGGTTVRDYSGRIDLANGLIGPGNSVQADASGRLSGGGRTVDVNAGLAGQFIGDSAQGVRMLDSAADARLDGTVLPAQVEILARTPG